MDVRANDASLEQEKNMELGLPKIVIWPIRRTFTAQMRSQNFIYKLLGRLGRSALSAPLGAKDDVQ